MKYKQHKCKNCQRFPCQILECHYMKAAIQRPTTAYSAQTIHQRAEHLPDYIEQVRMNDFVNGFGFKVKMNTCQSNRGNHGVTRCSDILWMICLKMGK